MDQVFPGFAEAMTRMQEGGEYRFSMPQGWPSANRPPPGFPKDSGPQLRSARAQVVRGGAAMMQQQLQCSNSQQQQAPQQ